MRRQIGWNRISENEEYLRLFSIIIYYNKENEKSRITKVSNKKSYELQTR